MYYLEMRNLFATGNTYSFGIATSDALLQGLSVAAIAIMVNTVVLISDLDNDLRLGIKFVLQQFPFYWRIEEQGILRCRCGPQICRSHLRMLTPQSQNGHC